MVRDIVVEGSCLVVAGAGLFLTPPLVSNDHPSRANPGGLENHGLVRRGRHRRGTQRPDVRLLSREGRAQRHGARALRGHRGDDDLRGDRRAGPSLRRSRERLAEELGAPHGADGYRFLMQTARNWVDETFESPEMRLFFASAGLHAGLAPDDPLGGHFAWMFVAAIQDVGCSLVRGGMHRVSEALAKGLRARGGTIRTNAEVASVVVENGRAVAVRLADGERIGVDGVIAANADPRHFGLDLLGDTIIGAEAASKLRRYEWGPSFFGIYAALDRPVAFRAGPEPATVCYLHASGASLDDLAASFVDIRAGRLPKNPMVGS